MPASDVPGEWASPTQPFPTKPAPFARQSFTEKDINPYLPTAERDAIAARMKTMRNDGLFTPPSFEGSIQIPGHNGGANFGTLGRRSGAWRVLHRVEGAARRSSASRCPVRCSRRRGARRRTDGAHDHAAAEGGDDDAGQGAGGESGRGRRAFPSPYEFMNTYSFGAAAIGPPWSEMVAYDLNTGDIKWRIPTGSVTGPADMKMPENTGFHFPRNAPLVTSGGLVFLATGGERKVRAYDRDNGRVLWTRDLPSGSEGMPASYDVNGRQFVVFPVATATSQFMANYNQPPRGAGAGPAAAPPAPAPAPGAPPRRLPRRALAVVVEAGVVDVVARPLRHPVHTSRSRCRRSSGARSRRDVRGTRPSAL